MPVNSLVAPSGACNSHTIFQCSSNLHSRWLSSKRSTCEQLESFRSQGSFSAFKRSTAELTRCFQTEFVRLSCQDSHPGRISVVTVTTGAAWMTCEDLNTATDYGKAKEKSRKYLKSWQIIKLLLRAFSIESIFLHSSLRIGIGSTSYCSGTSTAKPGMTRQLQSPELPLHGFLFSISGSGLMWSKTVKLLIYSIAAS